MQAPALPFNEAERLEALRSYGPVEPVPDPDFDDLALLAAEICDTPIALVTLVDEDHQWLKGRAGTDLTQTSREVSFCGHAILGTDLFIVPDTSQDARFADNPLVVADPNIRSYTGAPLITSDGYALGTVCVIDRQPRLLTPQQSEALKSLGRRIVALFELRRAQTDLTAGRRRAASFSSGPAHLTPDAVRNRRRAPGYVRAFLT
ncbi:MAG: GAF domain-containing protein [Gemmatimonadota bacterium]